MPRKNRNPDALVLNRENQRRSRARRRELIDGLQRRVAEYERRDAQATLAMQRVARAVAAENAILREMLAAKNVTSKEIDAHLASRNGQVDQNPAPPTRSYLVPRCRSSKQGVVGGPPWKPSPLLSENHKSRLMISEQRPPLAAAVSSQSPGTTRVTVNSSSSLTMSNYKHERPSPANNPLKQKREEHATSASIDEPDNDSSTFNMPSADPARYSPPDPPPRRLLTSDGMPCLDAAIILAQLKGHPDSKLAHAELGCTEGTDCTVRNTDVFRLMDEAT